MSYESNREWRARNWEQWQAGRNRTKRLQAEATAPTARNAGLRWTDWEDDVLINSVKTARELASELGRTYKSIEQRRHKLRLKGRMT